MDEQNSKFLQSFITESIDLLDIAEESILSLEKDFDQEKVDQLFRAIHTIKGNSGLFDLNKIKDLSHIFENVLTRVRSREIKPNVDMVDLFLLSVDRLKQLIDKIENSDSIKIDDLTNKLAALKSNEPTVAIQNESTAEPKSATEAENIESVFQSFCTKIRTKLTNVEVKSNTFLSCAVIELSNQGTTKLSDISSRLQSFRADRNIVLHGISPSLLPDFKTNPTKSLPYFVVFESEVDPEIALSNSNLKAIAIDRIHTIENKSAVEKIDQVVAPTTEVAQSASVVETHLKIPLSLIENLINLASETVIARNELIQKADILNDPSMSVSVKKISYLVSQLQEGIMRTRLQELEATFQRLPRLVRDVSGQTGKLIRLTTEGGNVELDKTLIDSIRDPLTHLIRNSIDHGIESPDERIKAGKPKEGRLRVEAFFRGGNVIIMIADDGKGLNLERIRQKAEEKGILTAEAAKRATDSELADLVFLPGFSTSQSVTTTSGRGVGMDVVRSSLKKVGGTAEISSVQGQGTTVLLTIPQTLSIVTCILIESGGIRYAVPQVNVKELLLLDPKNLDTIHDELAYELRGRLLPLVHLEHLLGRSKEVEQESITTGFIVVVETEQHRFGLLVDEILNPEEIVVKSLGQEFSEVKVFSGAAIMGDGEAVLILDTTGIARQRAMEANLDLEHEVDEVTDKTVQKTNELDEAGYLVFESASYYFGVPVSSMPRIEKIQVGQIETLLDFEVLNHQNRIVPLLRLEKVLNLEKRIELFNKREVYVILFTIDDFRIGFLANEVHNVMTEFEGLDYTTFTAESVIGCALVGSKTTMLLDIHSLTKRFQQGKFRQLKQFLADNLDAAKSGASV
ncbi:MAG: chemotaxis protein CheA [Leptonema sp. (in: Bacteria)]|nr:chemotaxis protein CheA [Leptonema sp. (in: bacteria)]